MAQPASVLILAELDDAERASLEGACTAAGFATTLEPSAEVATGKLGQKRFDALVVHMGTPGAALACMRTRGKLLRIRIPVIALADTEDDAAFARAYRAGADEVLVLGREAELVARLRALPKPSIPQPGNARGDAVVADADRVRGEVIERVLKDAGFRVEVVVDGFAARLQAGRPSLKVAVVDASLDDVPPLITLARSKGSRCAWVVRARPELLDDLRVKLARLDRVAVVSAYGPPDDVLFETNRMLEPRESDGRADPRLLYGTIVRLRWGGGGEPDTGYTYNVSPLGLFVRTLVPPASETLQIEAAPPGSETKVLLEGKVVWRREFGTTRKEPVPAGFGVQITGGNIDAWAEACPRVPSLRPPMPEEARPVLPKKSVIPRPSSVHPSVVAPTDVDIQPREPMASVEEMLASVLSETMSGGEGGAAPLSIDGGTVVELKDAEELEAEPAAGDVESPAAPPAAAPEVAALPEVLPSEPEPPLVEATEITPESLGFLDAEDAEEETSIPAETAPSVDAPSEAEAPPQASLGTSDTIPAPSLASAELEARALRPAPEPALPALSSSSPPPRASGPPEEELRIPTGRISPVVWVGLAIVIGAVAAVSILPRRGASPAAVAAAPATPAPPPAATEMPAAAPSAAEPAAARTPAPPSASAEAVAPPASAAAPEAPPPSAAAPAPSPSTALAPTGSTDTDVDPTAIASLKKGQGFLYVASPLKTNVYVYGNLAGTTNERLTTNCGPRFLRLGTAPGAWQSEGFVQIVKCGALTRVEMKP